MAKFECGALDNELYTEIYEELVAVRSFVLVCVVVFCLRCLVAANFFDVFLCSSRSKIHTFPFSVLTRADASLAVLGFASLGVESV